MILSSKRYTTIISLLVSLFAFHTAFADEDKDTQIGRYLTVGDKPKTSQVDLLSQIIQVRFPQKIQTLGDAMDYVLRLSGYSLVPISNQSSALKTTLTKPLPAIDRDFGPMPLKDGLSTLAGPAFYLVQDPINRMVDFRLKPQFAQIYSTKSDKSSSRQNISTRRVG